MPVLIFGLERYMIDMKSSVSCWYLSINTNNIAMMTRLIKMALTMATRTSLFSNLLGWRMIRGLSEEGVCCKEGGKAMSENGTERNK